MNDNKKAKFKDQRRIFVSYSRYDEKNPEVKEVIDSIKKFEDAKWEIIIDKEVLIPGKSYTTELQQLIECSHVVIILITKKSINRPYVNQEIGYTISNHIPLFPISIDGTLPRGMIEGMHVDIVSKENISMVNLIKVTTYVDIGFCWKRFDYPQIGDFIQKTIDFTNRFSLFEPILRYCGTLDNLNFLIGEHNFIKKFFVRQKRLMWELKLIIYKPKIVEIERTKKTIDLLEKLSEFIRDNARNDKLKIKLISEKEVNKSVFIISNLALIDLDNTKTTLTTNYAPYISNEINYFEEEDNYINKDKILLEIERDKNVLLKRHRILNTEISIEQRFLSDKLGLDDEIKNAAELRLFVTTMVSFTNGLREELKTAQIEELFPDLVKLKIYMYSFDVVSKHPPGKSINIIQKEWEENLEFVIGIFIDFKKDIDFEIIILNTLPTFTGIYAENNESKVFKITNMMNGVEPILIPQFIAWSDKFFMSSAIERFESLISDLHKDKHESVLVFPMIKRENEYKWKRKFNNNIGDFVDQLKKMSNEFPCCAHGLFTIAVNDKLNISTSKNLAMEYENQSDIGFNSIEPFSGSKWKLYLKDEKHESTIIISEKHVIAVFAIIIINDEILLIRNKKLGLDWKFDVPGGKMLISDKTLESALQREVFEELAFTLKLNIDNLKQIFIKYDQMSIKEVHPCIPIYYQYTLDANEQVFFDINKKSTKGYNLIRMSIEELLNSETEKCHIPKQALLKINKGPDK